MVSVTTSPFGSDGQPTDDQNVADLESGPSCSNPHEIIQD